MNQLAQEARRALGSESQITIVFDGLEYPSELFQRLWKQVESFENRFSRFISDSELCQLNASSGQAFSASDELIAIVKTCIEYFQETDGIFNPCVLQALQDAGYDKSFETLDQATQSTPSQQQVAPANSIIINGNVITLPKGVTIDLGGIGKGYLVDSLAKELSNLPGFWLSFGGDLYLSGVDDKDQPWSVDVQNPYLPNEDVTKITIPPGSALGVATSGTYKRRQANWHHLIDPRTGMPAKTDLLAVTVCGPETTKADVYASCCVILGSSKAKEFMSKKPGYSAYFFPEIVGNL